jgi:hypothetical protein
MSRPKSPPSFTNRNRVELLLNDNDYDWLTLEAKRRRIPRATLGRLLLIQAMATLEETIAANKRE